LFSPRAGVCSGRGWWVRGAFGGRSPASLSCFAVHPPASALAWAVRAVSAAWCSASRAWVAAASCLRWTSRASPRVFTRAMRSASRVLAAAAAAALPDRGGVGSLMPPVCRTPRWPRASGRPGIRHRRLDGVLLPARDACLDDVLSGCRGSGAGEVPRSVAVMIQPAKGLHGFQRCPIWDGTAPPSGSKI